MIHDLKKKWDKKRSSRPDMVSKKKKSSDGFTPRHSKKKGRIVECTPRHGVKTQEEEEEDCWVHAPTWQEEEEFTPEHGKKKRSSRPKHKKGHMCLFRSKTVSQWCWVPLIPTNRCDDPRPIHSIALLCPTETVAIRTVGVAEGISFGWVFSDRNFQILDLSGGIMCAVGVTLAKISTMKMSSSSSRFCCRTFAATEIASLLTESTPDDVVPECLFWGPMHTFEPGRCWSSQLQSYE